MMEEQARPLRKLDYDFFVRPCLGERVSGDTVFFREREDVLFIAIIDVLGHGPEAHVVARQAEDYLAEKWSRDIIETMQGLHAEIKGTRGAAAGLAVLNIAAGELSYTGVGNTVIRRFGPGNGRLFSSEGIIGSHIRTPRIQRLQLAESDVLLLYTDGVEENFKLQEYPQLVYQRARSITRTVIHRFGKMYDDATCIAVRYER